MNLIGGIRRDILKEGADATLRWITELRASGPVVPGCLGVASSCSLAPTGCHGFEPGPFNAVFRVREENNERC